MSVAGGLKYTAHWNQTLINSCWSVQIIIISSKGGNSNYRLTISELRRISFSISLHKGLLLHSIKGTDYSAQTNSCKHCWLVSSKQICEHHHLHLIFSHNNNSNLIDMCYISLPDHEKVCFTCIIPKIKEPELAHL